ncbi:8085_t:CDS:1, partial [Paraglomus occultum]
MDTKRRNEGIQEIRDLLGKAQEEVREAKAIIQKFEEGEAQGKLLLNLRKMWVNGGMNGGQQLLWEMLEAEKKRLEEEKAMWDGQ